MILRRYVMARAASRTLFVLAAGVALYTVVDMMGVSQQLARGTAVQIARLYLLRAPQMAAQLMPAAVVLGPLLAMGSLAKRWELAAMKFHGARMAVMVGPVFVAVGFAGALALAALREWVLPHTVPAAVSIQHRVFAIRGPRFWSYYTPRRWMRTPHGFLFSKALRPGEARDVVYLAHDGNFAPTLLVRAEVLRREGSRYLLHDGTVRDLAHLDQQERSFTTMPFPEALPQGALAQHLGYPEIFTTRQLAFVVRARERQGARVTPFRLALWRRLGDPLVLLALAAMAAPVGARARRGQMTERRILEGGAILGLHYLTRGVAQVVAGPESWRCALAALAPPLVVVAAAAALWTLAERESG